MEYERLILGSGKDYPLIGPADWTIHFQFE
jgi:hypothetical protein